MRKRSTYKPTDSYFYLERYLDKCLMRLNYNVGPVIIQMTNTQKMNISEMSMSNISNSHVYSSDKRES